MRERRRAGAVAADVVAALFAVNGAACLLAAASGWHVDDHLGRAGTAEVGGLLFAAALMFTWVSRTLWPPKQRTG